MTVSSKSPLITKWTDKISVEQRQRDTGVTAYAVGKIFSGASLPLNTDLDTALNVGIFRILHPTEAQTNIPPITNITGFLQVMDINRDEEDHLLYKGLRRIRQIIYPDSEIESAPYTRVGRSATVNGEITWSEWSMMGGGFLRRVVTTEDIDHALNNVLYEVFTDGLTIRLPNAVSVPVGTQIGVEQYVGQGTVICGDQEQITESDIQVYEPEEVISPIIVSKWTGLPEASSPYYHQVLRFEDISLSGDESKFTVSGSSVLSDPDNSTSYNKIDGTYTLVNQESRQDRIWKHTTKDIFCSYDSTNDAWMFYLSMPTGRPGDVVLYRAETTIKSADALVYIFECILADDGITREWALDVDNNFARAVNILSERLSDVEDNVAKIIDDEEYLHFIRTRNTRYIQDPATYQLTCIKPQDGDLDTAIATLRSNDYNVYFYDFVVTITSSCTINLPSSADIPVGAKVHFEVVGNCSVTVIIDPDKDGENYINSQIFTGSADSVLLCEFEYTKTAANTASWAILTITD